MAEACTVWSTTLMRIVSNMTSRPMVSKQKEHPDGIKQSQHLRDHYQRVLEVNNFSAQLVLLD